MSGNGKVLVVRNIKVNIWGTSRIFIVKVGWKVFFRGKNMNEGWLENVLGLRIILKIEYMVYVV